MHRFQNGSPIIGDRDMTLLRPCSHRLEDLVHALGAQGGLDQISDGHGAHEAGEPCSLRLKQEN